MLDPAVYNRFPVSDSRSDPLPAHPPRPNPPIPRRVLPTPSYTTINHPDVHAYLDHLDFVFQLGFHHYKHPAPVVYALAALAVFQHPIHPAHLFFWGPSRRAATAAAVQRVIDSDEYLAIPVQWQSEASALAVLAAAEARRAAEEQRRAARAGGAKAAVPPQKVQQRVTRASARQATEASTQVVVPSTSTSTPAPAPAPDKKRRRTPPTEAPVLAPQRASVRQQKQRTEVLPIPPAVVASVVRPGHARSRSTSQESSETLVASSRAASVASADTVVDVAVCVARGGKGKGRAVAPADEGENLAPVGSEGAGVVTRSRMTRKTAAEVTRAARNTPYPATKDGQLAAGRGKGSKAPTGKRKTAKGRK